MAQLSVTNYFNTKKRSIVEDSKINNARKVLILDEDNLKPAVPIFLETQMGYQDSKSKIAALQNNAISTNVVKKVITPKRNKLNSANSGNIRQFLNSMGKQNWEEPLANPVSKDGNQNIDVPSQTNAESNDSKPLMVDDLHFLPTSKTETTEQPSSVEQIRKKTEFNINDIKKKLSRSSRLAELKASISRFQQSEKKLEVAKQRTQETKDALTLKTFKTIELEVNLSPKKIQSPEKLYLSPKKDVQAARKTLFGPSSPVKKEVSVGKPSLTLPYKYRYLAEIFRSIDTVAQILYNRKETITFQKLKPAVEEMLKRNLTEKHLSQIYHLYPDAFSLQREKIRHFGTGSRNDKWELVLTPKLQEGDQLTPDILLERRRKLFNILIEKVKDYHQEFLTTLEPPMEIERNKITRWHPLFDIERVPDVELGELPPQPTIETFTSGHDVLQKAREMFNCNTRMERALQRLQESTETTNIPEPQPLPDNSILKGIPKALLEKVRQRQAAKALESMTRSPAKEKEVQLYSKLPEIARLVRNLFVTEKKSVLLRDFVIDKLGNSLSSFSNKKEMETYLRTIAKETNGWMVFHEIRGEVFIKLVKNSDLNVIMNNLQKLAESKDS